MGGSFVVCLKNANWFTALTASGVKIESYSCEGKYPNKQTNKKQFTAPSSTSLWNDVSSSETAVPPSELPIKCSCELGCFCFWRKGPDWELVDIYGWGSPQSLLSGFKSRFKHGAPSCVERTQRKAWFDSISVMHAGFLAAMCTSITSQRRAALQYQRRAFVNRTREVRIRGSGLGSRSGCRGEVSGECGGKGGFKIRRFCRVLRDKALWQPSSHRRNPTVLLHFSVLLQRDLGNRDCLFKRPHQRNSNTNNTETQGRATAHRLSMRTIRLQAWRSSLI